MKKTYAGAKRKPFSRLYSLVRNANRSRSFIIVVYIINLFAGMYKISSSTNSRTPKSFVCTILYTTTV